MLSILALETQSGDTPCASEIIRSGSKQRELPVKRLSTVRSIEAFAGEAKEEAKYNTVVMSLSTVQKTHIDIAIKLRTEWRVLFVIFVLENHADVSAVARPSIQVSGILFAPPEQAGLYKVIREVYREYVRINQISQPRFIVKNGAENVFVNTEDICFFEAKAKKIALKTLSQEISFYSNFDLVMEQLPAGFVRCHKGFVVNTMHVRSVNWREMSLVISDGSVLPISRNNKQTVVEALPRIEESE